MRVGSVTAAAASLVMLVGAATPATANVAQPVVSQARFDHRVAMAAQARDTRDLQDVAIHSFSFGPGVSGQGSEKADTSSAARWVCTVYASDPYRDGNEVAGDGWQSCTGAGYAPIRIRIKIQKRKLGIWTTIYSYKSDWTREGWLEATAWENCSGTNTYRIVTTGWAQSGMYVQSVKSLNSHKITC